MFRDGWDLVAALALTNTVSVWAWLYQHKRAGKYRYLYESTREQSAPESAPQRTKL